MDSEVVHSLQHSSFLLTALLFWWSVLPGASLRGRHGAAILSLFSTMVYTGGLGALLTLGRTLWYPAYGAASPLWGLTPLEDQQLAGLIMWVPGGVTYLLATLWLVAEWLRVSEARVVSRERARAASAALLIVVLLTGCDRSGGLVGPPLDGIGARAYVAGVLTNTPPNLTRWIQSPREIDPLTAMPDLNVSPTDARDIAAFLYTLR